MVTLSGIYRIVVERGDLPPKFYIGQTVNMATRRQSHMAALRAGRHDNVALRRAFNKYGSNSMRLEPVVACAPEPAILTEWEQYVLDFYIQRYGRANVYNVMTECVKSHLGVRRSAETKLRMSMAQRGVPKSAEYVARMKLRRPSPEARAKLSVALKGRKLSPERCAQISESQKNRTRSADIGAKISAGKLASSYAHSEETRHKIAAALRGKKCSPESCEKRRVAMLGRKIDPESKARGVATRRARAAAEGRKW